MPNSKNGWEAMHIFRARDNVFGETLFQLRRSRKLLQKVVASNAGLDQSYFASLEKGRRDAPRLAVIERILDGVSATEAERSELKRAAALSRLIGILEASAGEIAGAEALISFAVAIPAMDATELDAIETIIGGFHRRHHRALMEAAM